LWHAWLSADHPNYYSMLAMSSYVTSKMVQYIQVVSQRHIHPNPTPIMDSKAAKTPLHPIAGGAEHCNAI
jgi:hypothetical protein